MDKLTEEATNGTEATSGTKDESWMWTMSQTLGDKIARLPGELADQIHQFDEKVVKYNKDCDRQAARSKARLNSFSAGNRATEPIRESDMFSRCIDRLGAEVESGKKSKSKSSRKKLQHIDNLSIIQ